MWENNQYKSLCRNKIMSKSVLKRITFGILVKNGRSSSHAKANWTAFRCLYSYAGLPPQLHKVRNRMGIFVVGRNRMQNSWWPCGVSKFACWKHLYNGVDLVRFCNLPQKIYTHFSFFGHFSPIFIQPHQIWVFPACFLPSKMIITS